MDYDEAKKKAQADANADGYFRYLVDTSNIGGGWIIAEQDSELDLSDHEVVYAEDKCVCCGKFESEVKLEYHEESGEGWDHTDGGYYCSHCWTNTVQSI